MREVNFSIPNVNKASVGITAALYDRRALDCTSTLPLINSLNHLAYLTTSSARIRDILTVDGGVERLVCILKEGRSKEMMEMWKWNLAFQCVVNIGVRGSEAVRTRVVEADMVPVIATILDNFVRVMERQREEKEVESRRTNHRQSTSRSITRLPRDGIGRQSQHDRHHNATESRSIRRQAPPPAIDIPQPYVMQMQLQQQVNDLSMQITPTPPQLGLASQELTPSRQYHHSNHHHLHQRQDNNRSQDLRALQTRQINIPAGAVPPIESADSSGLRPVRDVDRLPSTIPALQNGITSQPESPTTPSALPSHPMLATMGNRQRPSLRQQLSNSGDSDDGGNEITPAHSAGEVVTREEPMVGIQANVEIGGGDDRGAMIDAVTNPIDLAPPNGSDGADMDTFNIAHRVGLDGSIITTNIPPVADVNNTLGLQPPPPPLQPIGAPVRNTQTNPGRFVLDRAAQTGVLAANPRDEDVLMSLQLLAYVSKYCNLRMYFQKSHLVPNLRVDSQLCPQDNSLISIDDTSIDTHTQEEYTLPDDYNIFPLVEKFTVRHNSQDMQYWAGVVMRNLCRKDDLRGGIRQCAYYQCGRWEKYTRQFAKCRRCRRTKYCSKECQKNAWVYHRHWCQVATS
ncbi:MAG: hypothetical protein LQ340_007454 [Diploschistes diacapsis]|nr:MAG: hypothetical protein LQ340_007454 [Diploschistes diacapsis]